MAKEFSDNNFNEVIKDNKYVIVDFWAEWCGPCRMIAPIVEEFAVEYEGRIEVGKVDVDNNPGITAQYGVRNIPTMLFFKDGNVVDKQVGAVSKNALKDKFDKLISL
ncbi:MAG: thioredoxin [Bacteroidetes bacterium GWE2_29_8]|nr:MAG: thioredoxin [Bacteroidetes bacterium GWE2_29_8]